MYLQNVTKVDDVTLFSKPDMKIDTSKITDFEINTLADKDNIVFLFWEGDGACREIHCEIVGSRQ